MTNFVQKARYILVSVSNKILVCDGRTKKFYVLVTRHNEVGTSKVIPPLSPGSPGASSGLSTTVSNFI